MEKTKSKIKGYFSKLDFNSDRHAYKYEGRELSSVSSIISRYVEPFDANKVAGFVARKRGITKQEVLAEWEAKKVAACNKGNRVHDYGERYGEYLSGVPNTVKFNPIDGYEEAVINFWDSIPDYIEPFLFELQMFSNNLGIAGTADLILYNRNTGNFIIADYKTNIDLFKNYKGKKMLPPFHDLLDSPYNKYQLQLSLYQHLFEQSGHKVEQRKIIWLKPDGTFESFQTINYIDRILKTL